MLQGKLYHYTKAFQLTLCMHLLMTVATEGKHHWGKSSIQLGRESLHQITLSVTS